MQQPVSQELARKAKHACTLTKLAIVYSNTGQRYYRSHEYKDLFRAGRRGREIDFGRILVVEKAKIQKPKNHRTYFVAASHQGRKGKYQEVLETFETIDEAYQYVISQAGI